MSVHRRLLSHAQFFDDSSVFWEAITTESPFSLYRTLCYDADYPCVGRVLRNLPFLLPAYTSDSHFFFQYGVIESLGSNPLLPHRLIMPLSLNIEVDSHLFVLIYVNYRLILPQ